MEDFTRTDLHAVWMAMLSVEHEAAEREERMPSSAEAMRRHAAQLDAVCEKIKDRVPAEVRATYPKRNGA